MPEKSTGVSHETSTTSSNVIELDGTSPVTPDPPRIATPRLSSDTSSRRSGSISATISNFDLDVLNISKALKECQGNEKVEPGVRASSAFRVACEKAAMSINQKYANVHPSGMAEEITSCVVEPVSGRVSRVVSFSPKIKVHTPEGSAETFHEGSAELHQEKRTYHNEICYEVRQLLTKRLSASKTWHELQVDYNTRPQLSCSLGIGSTTEGITSTAACSDQAMDRSDAPEGPSYFLTVGLPVVPNLMRGEVLKRRICDGNGFASSK